jgi:hypothetical protein
MRDFPGLALALAAGAASAAAAGGEDGAIWRPTGRLPGELAIRRVLLTADGTGIVAGTLPGDPPPGAGSKERREAERAAIFRSTDGGTTITRVLAAPGYVVAVDFFGEKHGWAVVSRPHESGEGSYYFLFSSEDAGAGWREIGQIHARSVTQVVRTEIAKGWLLGARTLMRTTDMGANWGAVNAPGTRNSASELLVADGPDGLRIVGPAIQRTRDGGATWETGGVEGGGQVLAAGGGYAVVTAGGETAFGRLEGIGFSRLSALPEGTRPAAIVAAGEVVRILAAVGKTPADREVVVLLSGDGGASFQAQPVPVPAPHHVGLRGAREGWAVTLDRRVLVTP